MLIASYWISSHNPVSMWEMICLGRSIPVLAKTTCEKKRVASFTSILFWVVLTGLRSINISVALPAYPPSRPLSLDIARSIHHCRTCALMWSGWPAHSRHRSVSWPENVRMCLSTHTHLLERLRVWCLDTGLNMTEQQLNSFSCRLKFLLRPQWSLWKQKTLFLIST